MDFKPSRFMYFLTDFVVTPSEWIQSLFTYFGHFGVQIFIFLSAYSLALSHSKIESIWHFLISRIKKLYPMFIGAILMWSVIYGYGKIGGIFGPIYHLLNYATDLFLLLFGVYPFVPDPDSVYPVVGPWWFMPYIMQFYVLWAVTSVFIDKATKRMLLSMIVFGVIFNFIVTPVISVNLHVNLMLTPFGHIPEIFTGIYFAKYGFSKLRLLFISSVVILFFSGLFDWLWPLHHLSALIVLLFTSNKILQAGDSRLTKTMYWLGVYSFPLFLVNGFLRAPFARLSREYST